MRTIVLTLLCVLFGGSAMAQVPITPAQKLEATNRINGYLANIRKDMTTAKGPALHHLKSQEMRYVAELNHLQTK